MDIKILVAAHKPYWMPDDPMYLPLHVGKQGKADVGFMGDDTGIHISQKNPNYCELTGIYWAWKNLRADYIGLAHYRRHFSTGCAFFKSPERKKALVLTQAGLEPVLRRVDIVLPRRRNYFIESNYSHYIHAHRAEGLNRVWEIIHNDFPEYTPACDRVMNRTWAHMFNMFVMKRPHFDAYCAWMFELLSRVEATVDISDYPPVEARIFGYLSEMLLDIWIETNRLPYEELPVVFMESRSWVKKGGDFLKRKIVHSFLHETVNQ